jgi:WD40 repeat protein
MLALSGKNNMHGLLLAIECAKRSSSPECDQALETALLKLPRRVTAIDTKSQVHLLAVDSGSRWALFGGAEAVTVLNLATGETVGSIKDLSPIEMVAISSDGERCFYATALGKGVVWETSTGRRLSELRHEGPIVAAAFAPGGTRLFTVAELGPGSGVNLYCWDLRTGRQLKESELELAPVSSVAFSPDARVVVTARENPSSLEAPVRLWDTTTGRESAHLFTGGVVRALAFNSDARWLAGGDDQGAVRIWDTRNGATRATMFRRNAGICALAFGRFESVLKAPEPQTVGELESHKTALQRALVEGWSILPRGLYVAASATDQTITVWEAMSGREIASQVHNHEIDMFAFGPWDVSMYTLSGDQFQAWQAAPNFAEAMELDSRIIALGLASGGKSILALGQNGTWGAWEAATGFPIFRASLMGATPERRPELELAAFTVRPDWVAIAGFAGPDHPWLWDAIEGMPVAALPPHDEFPTALAASPGGQWIASGTKRGLVSIFDTARGREVRRFQMGSVVTALSLSGDGLVAAGGRNGVTRLWSIATGVEVRRFDGASPVEAVSLDPKHRWMAIASADKQITVSSLSGPAGVRRLKRPEPIRALAFGTGDLLAVAAAAVEVMDPATGRILARRDPREKPAALQFIDGDQILLIAAGNKIDAWLWNRDSRLQEGCFRAIRNLTPAEWQESFGGESYRPTCEALGVQPRKLSR